MYIKFFFSFKLISIIRKVYTLQHLLTTLALMVNLQIKPLLSNSIGLQIIGCCDDIATSNDGDLPVIMGTRGDSEAYLRHPEPDLWSMRKS